MAATFSTHSFGVGYGDPNFNSDVVQQKLNVLSCILSPAFVLLIRLQAISLTLNLWLFFSNRGCCVLSNVIGLFFFFKKNHMLFKITAFI